MNELYCGCCCEGMQAERCGDKTALRNGSEYAYVRRRGRSPVQYPADHRSHLNHGKLFNVKASFPRPGFPERRTESAVDALGVGTAASSREDESGFAVMAQDHSEQSLSQI